MQLEHLKEKYQAKRDEAEAAGPYGIAQADTYGEVLADLDQLEVHTAGKAKAPTRLIGDKEAAVRLGLDRSWIYRRQLELPFVVHVGAGVKVNPTKLERYIAEHTGSRVSRAA